MNGIARECGGRERPGAIRWGPRYGSEEVEPLLCLQLYSKFLGTSYLEIESEIYRRWSKGLTDVAAE